MLGSQMFAANNANFHELIKENPRKSAKSAAKVLGFRKKLTPTRLPQLAGYFFVSEAEFQNSENNHANQF